MKAQRKATPAPASKRRAKRPRPPTDHVDVPFCGCDMCWNTPDQAGAR